MPTTVPIDDPIVVVCEEDPPEEFGDEVGMF
jgi:hypothetical protein